MCFGRKKKTITPLIIPNKEAIKARNA